MVTTFPAQKRQAIAEKLADMKMIQSLFITSEQRLLRESQDSEISERLAKMIEDDQKNLGIIETSIIQYGIQADPKQTTQKLAEQTQHLMEGTELSLYEKVTQHELLKHGQVMTGILVHKAGQIAGADIAVAITPLNTVNFENRAHQEQLKGMIEVLGTLELTGQKADQSIWARAQDAAAALTGVVGSFVSQNSDRTDVTIQEIIHADHQKAMTLLAELEFTTQPEKINEYFVQLYSDLLVHSTAEEEVVYPIVRPFYGSQNTQELYDEQAGLKAVLEGMTLLDPTLEQFKTQLRRVKQMVEDHTLQEESSMFAAIAKNCSLAQQQQMATQFKQAKQQLQVQM